MKFKTSQSLLNSSLLALLLAAYPASILQAAEQTDPADPVWRQFQHALGEPAAIGVNADHPAANTAYRPVPVIRLEDIDAHKYLLGNDLFHDRRLSVDDSMGCVRCHGGPLSGTDGRSVSLGVNRALGNFNALSLLNAPFNFRQFWDGRAITQADQALGPLENELEMANTLDAVLVTLQSDVSYVEDFQNLYPDGVTINNMADAIAYFQRIGFTVSDSPFQRHINGEQGQLSESALRGLQRFSDIGCDSCHNGINLGGNSYQRIGFLRAYYTDMRPATVSDEGAGNRSGRDQDLYAYKVPGLHNVAMTAPYFHDGSVATLNTAIAEMAVFQHGRGLNQQDIDDIAEFLRSTTGRPTGLQLASQIEQRARVTDPAQFSSAGVAAGSHEDAYRSVATSIAPVHQQLVVEMRRVQDGTVEHFDFVQFQHLELIRHARALQFPPSNLAEDNPGSLQTRAAELLTKVLDLEWVIADFLYARAMVGVLDAQLGQPGASAIDNNDLIGLIEQHRAAAARHLSTLAGVTLIGTLIGDGEIKF